MSCLAPEAGAAESPWISERILRDFEKQWTAEFCEAGFYANECLNLEKLPCAQKIRRAWVLCSQGRRAPSSFASYQKMELYLADLSRCVGDTLFAKLKEDEKNNFKEDTRPACGEAAAWVR